MQAELTEMIQLARANAAAVWAWDPELESLQIVASAGLSRSYILYGNMTAVTPMSKAYAPIYRSYAHGFPAQFVEPKRKDRYPGVFDEWSQMLTYAQVATFPVVVQNAILGVVSLYFARRRPEATHTWQRSLSFGLFADRVARHLLAQLPTDSAPEFLAFEAREQRGQVARPG